MYKYRLDGGMHMIKVLIVDDQEIIRQSLELMLSNRVHMDVVGVAVDGRDAIEKVRKTKPDVVLLDIRMPGMDGIETLRIIKEFSSDTKVLILTTFDDDEYIYQSLKYGANGFLLKGVSIDELVKAIELIHSGGAIMETSISAKVFSLFEKMAKADYVVKAEEKEIDGLLENELKIMQGIGRGLSNKEIAQHLNFTDGTVRNYISSILKKLELRDRTQIAIFTIQSSIMLHTFED